MKTLKLLLSCSFLIFIFSSSYGQAWLWGAGAYGPVAPTENGNSSVATDKNGNVYITATSLSDSLIIGGYTLHGTHNEAYIVKYNSSGKVVWVENITGGISTGNSIATDASGNVYMTGIFSGTIKVDTSSLTSTIVRTFLVKYDQNGNVLWAKQSQTPSEMSSAIPFYLGTDDSNNIFMTGVFQDTVSFGNYTLNTHYNAIYGNNYNIFIVKYNQNGNVLWAQQSETPSAPIDGGNPGSATIDKSGNVYIAGGLGDTTSFGPYSLTGESLFLVKYSPTGSVLWAKQSTGGGCYASSVISDGTNFYVTGEFEDTVKLGSHTIYSPPSVISMFLAKYDANGNAIWAKQSSENWEGCGVTSDSSNHIYLTGFNQGQNPDSFKFNGYTLYSNPTSSNATYILKMDTAGNVLCGSILNNLGFGGLVSSSIASDYTGTYIYTASLFNQSAIVDCGPDTLKAKGSLPGPNGFVGRWQPCNTNTGTTTIKQTTAEEMNVYPNPNNGIFHITGVAPGQLIEVYNYLGQELNTVTASNSSIEINISDKANGIYLIRISNRDGTLAKDQKIIKTQ